MPAASWTAAFGDGRSPQRLGTVSRSGPTDSRYCRYSNRREKCLPDCGKSIAPIEVSIKRGYLRGQIRTLLHRPHSGLSRIVVSGALLALSLLTLSATSGIQTFVALARGARRCALSGAVSASLPTQPLRP